MLENEYNLKISDYSNCTKIEFENNDLFIVDRADLYKLINMMKNYNKTIKLIYFTKPFRELYEHQYTERAKEIQQQKINSELSILNDITMDIILTDDVLGNVNRLWEWLIEQELGVDWLYD